MTAIWNWSLLALSTVATSALLVYTTQYLLRDHHNTLQKNKFKRIIKQTKHELEKIDTKLKADELKLKDLSLIDVTGSKRHQKQLLFLNESFIHLLEKLDQLNPTLIKNELDLKQLDQRALEFIDKRVEKARLEKRDLIERIHKNCKELDSLLAQIQ